MENMIIRARNRIALKAVDSTPVSDVREQIAAEYHERQAHMAASLVSRAITSGTITLHTGQCTISHSDSLLRQVAPIGEQNDGR